MKANDAIKAYGVRQTVLGQDVPEIYYFKTKEERDDYCSTHDYCDKLRAKNVKVEDIQFPFWYADYQEYWKNKIEG